ncbi:MAG: prepilin-type N-terminal cleavage/methylation domain-containing protein [Patescibacteria group bacterium]
MSHRKNSTTRGMTLVEVLMTVAVVAVVMVSASDAVLSLYRANSTGTRGVSQVGSARHALDALMEELRQSSYGNDGSYPIVSIATSSITFFSAIPNSSSAMRVQYQLSSTTLNRSTVSPGTPPTYTSAPVTSVATAYSNNVAMGIPIFRYYDKNGLEITDMTRTTDVRSVSIAISILNPGMTTPFMLTATTTLRNLRGI